jgi:hypothetical protein
MILGKRACDDGDGKAPRHKDRQHGPQPPAVQRSSSFWSDTLGRATVCVICLGPKDSHDVLTCDRQSTWDNKYSIICRRGPSSCMVLRSDSRIEPCFSFNLGWCHSQSHPRSTPAWGAAAGAGPTPRRYAIGALPDAPHTHLSVDTWERMLSKNGLTAQYPRIIPSLRFGFSLGICHMTKTFVPPNGCSLSEHNSIIQKLVRTKLQLGRRLGPFSRASIKQQLGPFHCSPVSLVEKPQEDPAADTKFWLVQNYSAPRIPQFGVQSINSQTFPLSLLASRPAWRLPCATSKPRIG